MSVPTQRRRAVTALAATAALSMALAGCASSDPAGDGDVVELTMFTGNVEANVQITEALIEAFEAANPDIRVNLDSSGPSGSEYDNVVKTRLATGEMADMFGYNSGSLFQALAPDQTLLPFGDAAWVDNLNETYRATVSTDQGVYGTPLGTSMGGGVLYYIPDYEELGLEVPTTWDEFMANNEALAAAGKAPVIQSYSDTWTAQMTILADYYNVYASDEDWATAYTANERKYAEDPVAARGFEKLQELSEAGYLNEDFASTTYDQALAKLAAGEGTHYPMLTLAVDTIVNLYPEAAESVGFFALPGDEENGLTVWMPLSYYGAASTEHPEEVLRFMEFVASPEGCEAQASAGVVPTGPWLVEGCELPADVPRAIADMLPYFESDATAPALEFLSPIKGPALEQIAVEVGSGIRPADDAAALYDDDVVKQAQQLGIDGW